MKNVLILLFFLLFGCVRQELVSEIEIDKNDSTLIIYSLITPSKWIYVNVRKTIPIGEENNTNIYSTNTKDSTFDLVTGANVEIENLLTNKSLLLPEVERGVYGVSPDLFPIVSGGKYALTVSYRNKKTYAQCEVPSQAAMIDRFIASPLKVINDTITNNGKVLFVKLSSSDLLMSGKDISNKTESLNYVRYIERETKKINGKVIKVSEPAFGKPDISNGEFIFYGGVALNQDDVSQLVSVQILTVFPIFQEYFQNYYLRLNQKSNLQENPFMAFKGVIPVITNIQNGYGIFAGYLISPPKQIVVTR